MGRRIGATATATDYQLDLRLDHVLGLAAYNRLARISRRDYHPSYGHSQLSNYLCTAAMARYSHLLGHYSTGRGG